MTEMSPQEAAAVWARVPDVEQQLTPRVVGLANILTGLAIAVLGIPMVEILPIASPWNESWAMLSWTGLVLLFLGLRGALWSVYGLAKPGGRGILYRYRVPGSWKWLPVDWWYLAAFLWGFFGAWWADAPAPIDRSTEMIALFLTVYTVAGGIWEARQSWSRRPYLLVFGTASCLLGWAMHLAGISGTTHVLYAILGLGWFLAGTGLYNQA